MSIQSRKYGDCVNKKYQDVEKDMCMAEFMAFKACAQKVVSDFTGGVKEHFLDERDDLVGVFLDWLHR